MPKHLFYDTDEPPASGDVVAAMGRSGPTGTYYRVLRIRPVERRTRAYAGPRWWLDVDVIASPEPDDVVWPLYWYPRRARR